MKKFFLLLALPLLLACGKDDDISDNPDSLVGVWQVTDIQNEFSLGAVVWDSWREVWGDIYLCFEPDGRCYTTYYGASDRVEERQSQGLPDFPYVYSRYQMEGNNIRCYDPKYDTLNMAVFEVKSISGGKMEVILQDGMYCSLSSSTQAQLRMRWKKVDGMPPVS